MLGFVILGFSSVSRKGIGFVVGHIKKFYRIKLFLKSYFIFCCIL